MRKEAMAILFAALIVVSDVSAQSAADQAESDSDQIMRSYEQEREFEELRRELERERRSLDLKADDKQERQLEQQGSCFDVKQIDVRGASLLTSEEIARLKEPYLDRCLYLSDINNLTEAVTNRYIDRGYVTSRAYVPAQDLTDRLLQLEVVEGHIEKINLNNTDESPPRGEIHHAFPGLSGNALNLRDLEQGLDQINRLESNRAKLQLQPGEAAGGSVVEVNNQVSRRWHAGLGIDNSGTESTGELQGFLDLTYDNLLGINDLLYVHIKHDLENEANQRSRSFYSRAEVPYGYWTISYAFSYFDYESRLNTIFRDFQTTGLSRIHDVGIGRVINRNRQSKTTALLNLTAKENINQLEGFTLDVSSQKQTLLHLGVRHVHRLRQNFVYGILAYERGLDWLGARKDRDLQPEEPHAQFNKVTLDAGLVFSMDLGLHAFNPRLNLNGRAQWSDETLFSTEQLSLGGPYSIRGFKDASIGGDIGALLRSDVSIGLPTSGFGSLDKVVGQIRPFIAFDVGTIRSDNGDSRGGGSLKSFSLGIKNEYGKASVELVYSRTVSSPSFVSADDDQVFLTAAVTL